MMSDRDRDGPADSSTLPECIVKRYNLYMSYREYAQIGRIARDQGGLITTTQAERVGVTRMTLSRMAAAGAVTRLLRGVYRLAGVPESEHEHVLATTLALGSHSFSPHEVPPVVAAGQTAATIHRLGDFLPLQMELISRTPMTTAHPGVHLRTSPLTRSDITFIDAIPVLTVEATIVDIIETSGDLSLAADALADARRLDTITDTDHLHELLAESARRRHFSTVDDLLKALEPHRHPSEAA